MTPFILLFGALGLMICLVGEGTGRWRLRAIGKIMASTGFLAYAWTLDLLVEGPVGIEAHPHVWAAVGVALALGWAGDVALLSADRRGLLAGIVLFLLGHVAWMAVWWELGGWLDRAALGAALVGVMLIGVWRWLSPHLTKMRGPVIAYFGVTALMVTAAWSAGWEVGLTALVFAASDVCVARQRFVVQDPWNRFIGLPLYYAAQYGFVYLASQLNVTYILFF